MSPLPSAGTWSILPTGLLVDGAGLLDKALGIRMHPPWPMLDLYVKFGKSLTPERVSLPERWRAFNMAHRGAYAWSVTMVHRWPIR